MSGSLAPTDRIQAMAKASPVEGVRLLAGLEPHAAFDLIIEHPRPQDVVALIPTESLYLMLHHIGAEDALILVELASSEQVRGFLDIDAWDRDRIDVAKARTWFVLINELEDDIFVRDITSIDLAFLVAFFAEHLQVHKLDNPDDEMEIDGVTVVTPDNRHVIVYTCGAELSKLVNALLMRIERLAPEFLMYLLEAIYWEHGSEVEESAYHERLARMESRGFPTYHAAIEILATVDVERFAPARKIAPAPAAAAPGAAVSGSHYLTLYAHPDSLLRRVLAEPFDGRDEIVVEIMGLTNMAVVAAQVPFFELEKVRRLVNRTDGLLSIGLEFKSGGDLDRAREWLVNYRAIDVHKIGRSLVMREHRRAHGLLARIAADGKSLDRLLVDGPEADLIEGLLRRDPVRLQGGTEHLWTNLAQLRDAAATLDAVEELSRVLERNFGIAPGAFESLALAGTNLPDIAELSYRVLFNTVLANELLGRPPAPAPLAPGDLPTLAAFVVAAGDGFDLEPERGKQLAQWLAVAVEEPRRADVARILWRYVRDLAGELVRRDIPPEIRREVLIRLTS